MLDGLGGHEVIVRNIFIGYVASVWNTIQLYVAMTSIRNRMYQTSLKPAWGQRKSPRHQLPKAETKGHVESYSDLNLILSVYRTGVTRKGLLFGCKCEATSHFLPNFSIGVWSKSEAMWNVSFWRSITLFLVYQLHTYRGYVSFIFLSIKEK